MKMQLIGPGLRSGIGFYDIIGQIKELEAKMDKKEKGKESIILIVTIILSAIYIILGNRASAGRLKEMTRMSDQSRPVRLRVVDIMDEHYEQTMYPCVQGRDQVVLFTAKFTGGLRRGEEVFAIQVIDLYYDDYTPMVKSGDRIVAYENRYREAPGVGYMFSRYTRTGFLVFLGAAFAAALVLLGRKKGVRTLISLSFTILAVFLVFIPRAITGANIYLWTLSCGIFIIIMTMLVNNGIALKSMTACIGCISGVAVAGLITLIADRRMHMTGFINEESIYLLGVNGKIDLRAVMFAGIVFGSIGAVMDVAVSLSSSLYEIREQAPDIETSRLIKSGLVIGQDMMGTMSNTLILAYIGSSLTIAMLLTAYNTNSMLALFNSEMIRAELLQALAGSIGILLTIPLTSLICGILYTKDK